MNSTKNSQTTNLFKTKYSNAPIISNDTIEKLIQYVNHIIDIENINFIIPTMDICHFFLSKYSEKINCKIITSDFKTNQICIDKEKTYNYFKNYIKCPKIISNLSNIQFPVFIKPKQGYGSRNCIMINNRNELNFYNDTNMLILEYLPGEEYTIDCITLNDKLIYLYPRKRKLTRAGLSIITEQLDKNNSVFKNILNYGKKINSLLKFKGSWFFQIKMDKNQNITLLEISTRIAGASSINRLNNVNLILNSIYIHNNYPVKIVENNLDNINVSKIYKSTIDSEFLESIQNIYIDFDDTLIVHNKINNECISLIYKYLNKKNIYLITRHKKNIGSSLEKYKINPSIFSSIIHINNNEKKSLYIKKNSIFFDDSFRERISCINSNIYVFDVDCISFFI